ncbi:MAG: hypothetical protein KKB25_01170 [Nanoarchaeota archaeon]|nr:hypothetical protein [Nanoarchaeota archaeon]
MERQLPPLFSAGAKPLEGDYIAFGHFAFGQKRAVRKFRPPKPRFSRGCRPVEK